MLHHGLGLASCAIGLYGNRMALFGAAIQVFFEGTTPLLHALGCLRAMGLGHTRLFTAAGVDRSRARTLGPLSEYPGAGLMRLLIDTHVQ